MFVLETYGGCNHMMCLYAPINTLTYCFILPISLLPPGFLEFYAMLCYPMLCNLFLPPV